MTRKYIKKVINSGWHKKGHTKPKNAYIFPVGNQINKGRASWNKGKEYFQIKGDKHPNWKGGISKKNKTERQLKMETIEYKLWHDSCFARDGYTCQKYGDKGGRLIVHHIFNYQDYPELRTSIENGITLSVKAHKEFHKLYGHRNTTREQLLEFLNT